ncbi:IMPACT family protein [Jiulongibacter sp. NS-SX5]|uniref:IMPACT family protein n=1 Tax=Jiulongibacter sp. NS-SX5 TaxID=3463854 RepID=UPI0040584A20
MTVSDTYFTISAPSEGLFKDKGSKFFGYAYPVEDEDEVKFYLDELRKQHPKARHYCYAYRLGTDDLNFRANDDGEPSGSAGKPILNVLLSKNLRNVLVVVVRYFGGTQLGVPGLINAYKMGSQEALREAKLEEKTINETLRLSFKIEYMNEVMKIIKKYDLNIIAQDYTTQYILNVEVRLSLLKDVKREVEELRFVEVES